MIVLAVEEHPQNRKAGVKKRSKRAMLIVTQKGPEDFRLPIVKPPKVLEEAATKQTRPQLDKRCLHLVVSDNPQGRLRRQQTEGTPLAQIEKIRERLLHIRKPKL